jgi:amino acid transporter
MIPESLSQVDSRFGQPLRLLAIEGSFALVFFFVLILAPYFSPVNYTWWYTLMVMPAYIFPAISALLLPKRRPELMQAVPWRRWLTPVSILWLAVVIPFYSIAFLIGISGLPLTSGVSLWEYAISTGVIATTVTIGIGIMVYYIIRAYNLRRGIDLNQIFQRIPPE